MDSCAVEGCNRAHLTVQELQLSGIREVMSYELYDMEDVPSLQQLVAAALPAGTQPSQLRSLCILDSSLPLAAVLDCPFLGHLTSLVLCKCSFSDAAALAGLESLLRQAPQLHSLTLQGFKKPPFPPALVNQMGLQQLCLRSNSLTDLPPGPYLHSEFAQ